MLTLAFPHIIILYYTKNSAFKMHIYKLQVFLAFLIAEHTVWDY